MSRNGKYPDELRERAVRMVLDHGHEYGSQWEAICSVADKLGSADRGPRAETVRLWVRQAEKDTGRRDDRLDRPADLVERQFRAPAPNRLWVADLTYVKTHSGGSTSRSSSTCTPA
jgi:transposase-like protein